MLTRVRYSNKSKNDKCFITHNITIACHTSGNKYKIKSIDKSKFAFFNIIKMYK